METFWKMVPLIIGVKAFYSSCIALGLCTLFKVQRLNLHHNITMGDESLGIIEETYFFGLWTYTDNVQIGETLENFFTKEIERNETCRFDMNEYSILHDHLQLRQLCWDFSARFPYISQQLIVQYRAGTRIYGYCSVL